MCQLSRTLSDWGFTNIDILREEKSTSEPVLEFLCYKQCLIKFDNVKVW